MIDCKITENYLTERKRMCNKRTRCSTCPLGSNWNGKNKPCIIFEPNYPSEAIEIVQKWSNEHPQKTLLTEFLRNYPKTELNSDGCPSIAPCELGIVKLKDECKGEGVHHYPCKECWNTPINEREETK